MKVATSILFLALGAFFLSPIKAEDVEEDMEITDDDEDFDASSITTKYIFPEHDEKRLPLGKEVTVLVDFANSGVDVYNVTKIGAHLHSPHDLSYFIQNFTVKETAGVASPGNQVSLSYTFTPDAKLEPIDFWLSGFVEYTVEGSDEPLRVTFVNGTVELYETGSGIDFATFMTYVLVLAVMGAGAYGFTQTSMGKSAKKKYTAPPSKKEVDDSWDVNIYKPKEKAAKNARRKKVSKK